MTNRSSRNYRSVLSMAIQGCHHNINVSADQAKYPFAVLETVLGPEHTMADIDTPYASPINLSKATILITGGSSGIGLGMAAFFLKAGSTVIICGRRESELAKAKAQYPALITYSADVGDAEEVGFFMTQEHLGISCKESCGRTSTE